MAGGLTPFKILTNYTKNSYNNVMAGIVTMQNMMDITFMTLAYIASLLYICASCVTMAAAGAEPASSTTSSMYSASL